MLEDIVIRLEDNFSEYLTDIRENEDKRIANELIRIENERLRQQYFEQLLKDKKSYYKRIRKVYKTISVQEKEFALPEEYTVLCMLDVFVNGFYLNPSEYSVADKKVVLTRALDVIGSVVEIVVTRAIGITTEDYDNLRGLQGFSAYELAVQNGFRGSLEEWLWSLRGSGGYERFISYYKTTTENENRIKLPSVYTERHLLDVFVNGFKLGNEEFSVEEVEEEYFLVLAKALDVIGTSVEIDVIDAFPTSFVETDPTVPAWAKAPEKPRYTAEEVGALPNTTKLFSKRYGDLLNKPKINGVEISGNKTLEELGIEQKGICVEKEPGKELITTAEKNKLAGIQTGANKTVVDSTLSETSTNPVQNKIIKAELEKRVLKETGKGLSTNDFTNADKTKLDGLKNYDDTTLKSQINNKVDKETGKSLISDTEITRLAGVDNYDDTEVRQTIIDIETEQATQDESIQIIANNIVANVEEITKLKEENKILKSQFPIGQAEGESIHLTDSAGGLEIENLRIKGKTYQAVREGYNLFNKNNYSIKSLNSTNPSGSFFATASNQKHIYITCKPTTTYTVIKDISNIPVLGIYETEEEPAVGISFTGLYFSSNSNGKQVVTTSENAKYLDIRINTEGITQEEIDTIVDSLLIYEGTEEKGYEEYGKTPSIEFPSAIENITGNVEVGISGKNLIKFAKEDWIGGAFSSSGNIDNWGGYNIRVSLIDSKYYMLPDNVSAIIFSFMPLKKLTVGTGAIAFYDKDKNPIKSINTFYENRCSAGIKAVRRVPNFNVPDNAKYFRINFKKVMDLDSNPINMYEDFYNYISDLQLEVGTQATEYVPYEGSNYSLTLSNLELLEGEYIHKMGNNWYKHKIYEKIESYNNEEITTDYISTTGALSEGATVYYKLATETEEEITDETLIDELNALNEAKTAKEITNVNTVTDGLKPVLSFDYKKDLETIRKNDKKEFQDEMNNLREAIVALGGV